MTTAADPYLQSCLISLNEALADIMSRFPVEPATAMMTLFELQADLLRRWAPLEFDAYLALLSQQLQAGPPYNQGVLNVARQELFDIITLASST